MSNRNKTQQRSLAEQASWELVKLARVIRWVNRRGDQAVCQRLLVHARRVQDFIERRQFSQALHMARCRMKG